MSPTGLPDDVPTLEKLQEDRGKLLVDINDVIVGLERHISALRAEAGVQRLGLKALDGISASDAGNFAKVQEIVSSLYKADHTTRSVLNEAFEKSVYAHEARVEQGTFAKLAIDPPLVKAANEAMKATKGTPRAAVIGDIILATAANTPNLGSRKLEALKKNVGEHVQTDRDNYKNPNTHEITPRPNSNDSLRQLNYGYLPHGRFPDPEGAIALAERHLTQATTLSGFVTGESVSGDLNRAKQTLDSVRQTLTDVGKSHKRGMDFLQQSPEGREQSLAQMRLDVQKTSDTIEGMRQNAEGAISQLRQGLDKATEGSAIAEAIRELEAFTQKHEAVRSAMEQHLQNLKENPPMMTQRMDRQVEDFRADHQRLLDNPAIATALLRGLSARADADRAFWDSTVNKANIERSRRGLEPTPQQSVNQQAAGSRPAMRPG